MLALAATMLKRTNVTAPWPKTNATRKSDIGRMDAILAMQTPILTILNAKRNTLGDVSTLLHTDATVKSQSEPVSRQMEVTGIMSVGAAATHLRGVAMSQVMAQNQVVIVASQRHLANLISLMPLGRINATNAPCRTQFLREKSTAKVKRTTPRVLFSQLLAP